MPSCDSILKYLIPYREKIFNTKIKKTFPGASCNLCDQNYSTMKPRGAWTLYAAQTICVGFLSSPGEGACAVMTGCDEIHFLFFATHHYHRVFHSTYKLEIGISESLSEFFPVAKNIKIQYLSPFLVGQFFPMLD
jgi:hypothetical protein